MLLEAADETLNANRGENLESAAIFETKKKQQKKINKHSSSDAKPSARGMKMSEINTKWNSD